MSRLGKIFRAAAAVVAISAADRAMAQDQDVTPAGGRFLPVPKQAPCPAPCLPAPVMPYNPATPTSPTTPTTPTTPNTPVDTPAPEPSPSFASTLAGAGAGETISLGGYIDNARPVTMFRLRGDFGYGTNRADRAEFFYPKCGCYMTPDAKGPPLPETNVDYQEILPYFEYAIRPNLSIFATIPVRFINPAANANTSGLGDITFGGKYAFINTACRVWSFQTLVTTPSGDGFKGLGAENWRIEPGLLFLEQINPQWGFFGEFRDSINLSRISDFTGNVLRYGLGTSYAVYQSQSAYVAPVAEFVGWTVLSGKETTDAGATPASGDTIVNMKLGVRIGFGGPMADAQLPTNSDVYIGYGRALTGEVWYKDMLRLEYRRRF